MKLITFVVCTLLSVCALADAQQPGPDQLKATQDRYQLEFQQLDAAEAAALAPSLAAYAKDLLRLKEAAQAKGDLKKVVELEALVAAVNAGTANEPAAAADSGLRTAFASYQRSRVSALRPFVTRRQLLQSGYTQEVSTLEVQYTRSGQIEAAKAARDAKLMAPGSPSEIIASMSGVTLEGGKGLKSEKTYKTPVEIEWRFQTDGDVRLSYACDQLIFNWGPPPHELRIDGGPAGGQHKKGQGAAPNGKVVAVKLTVLPRLMTVSLDGRERARWTGDFSDVDQAVSIHSHARSVVKVEQVIVRKLK